MKIYILTFIIVMTSVNINAQKNKVDSLILVLNKSVDSNRVNLLNELSRSLWYYELNTANTYNLEAMSLADSINYRFGIAEANRCHGVILNITNNSSAMPYLEKALNIFKELDNKKGIAATLNNKGNVYLNNGQYPNALNVLFQALKHFNELGDREAVGAVTNQVGNVYNSLGEYANALDYFSKALAIRRQIFDKPGTAFSLNRVGNMYFKMGKLSEAITNYKESYEIALFVGRSQNIIDAAINIGHVYNQQGRHREALSYFKTSLKEEEKFFGKDSIGFSYQHLGETYLLLKNYNASLLNFQKALQIADRKKSNYSAIILQQLARVYFEQGNYKQALDNCLRSLELSKQTKNNESLKQASFTLSQIYAVKGDFANAYKYHQLYAASKDSVVNENLNNKLVALEQSFEINNRQTQIDLLNRDNELKQSEISRQKQQRYVFIAGIFLFGLLAMLLLSINRQKQKTNHALEKAYSDLKSAQKQLIQSEKMASLGELTAGIAHEIQNPLNFVNNFSEVSKELIEEVLEERKKEKGERDEALEEEILGDIKENLSKINNHGQRASSIVKGMLEHSRKSSGTKEPTVINALCDEYLRMAYNGFKAKDKTFHAEFETQFEPNILKIEVVPQDMGRVLLNLINNAFYAVNEQSKNEGVGYKPTVTITTQLIANSQLLITVKDNGLGIPESIKDKIFQPFFTTKPTGQGTGLGLSLAYDIVKAHGGELQVETKEGEGSIFFIQLPIYS